MKSLKNLLKFLIKHDGVPKGISFPKIKYKKEEKMPITREKFLKGDFDNRKHRKEHPVALFLRENRKNAFTIKEICNKVKMHHYAVRNIIAELKKRKLISHTTPYFMWKK